MLAQLPMHRQPERLQHHQSWQSEVQNYENRCGDQPFESALLAGCAEVYGEQKKEHEYVIKIMAHCAAVEVVRRDQVKHKREESGNASGAEVTHQIKYENRIRSMKRERDDRRREGGMLSKYPIGEIDKWPESRMADLG